jgi:hypothetical protein
VNCVEARALWQSEPLEAVGPGNRAELDRHCAACAACRREVALLETIRAELPALAARPRRRAWGRVAAAAAAVAAALWLGLLMTAPSGPSREELARDLGAHLSVAEAFCRETANLRGEDPARDARLVAAEWEASGLRETTSRLDPALVRRHFGDDAGRYAAAFRRAGALVAEGRVAELQRALGDANAETLAATLRPAFAGTPRVTTPAGNDDVARFVAARASFYAGQTKQAETLFDLFCEDHPSSPYAADAAYWAARCARERGDTRTLLERLSRVSEPEWIDDDAVRDFREALARPGAMVVRAPDGSVRVFIPLNGRGPVIASPAPALVERATK